MKTTRTRLKLSPKSTTIPTKVEVFHPRAEELMGVPVDEWKRLTEMLQKAGCMGHGWLRTLATLVAGVAGALMVQGWATEGVNWSFPIGVALAIGSGFIFLAERGEQKFRTARITDIIEEMNRLRAKYSTDD